LLEVERELVVDFGVWPGRKDSKLAHGSPYADLPMRV
jgi:hypothetical protein